MSSFKAFFHKTRDGEQISYKINFSPKELRKDETIVVFNYGLVCSNHHWSKQLEHFSNRGLKILVHDYRGHYLSSGDDKLENITFQNIARDVDELLGQVKAKHCFMIGHSMGVNICLEFAKLRPEMVKGLVLISGTIVPVFNIMFDSNITDQLSPLALKALRKYPKTFQNIWKYSGWNPLFKKIIHAGGFNLKTVSEEFIEIYLNRLGRLGPEMFFHMIEQMHKHDILSQLQKIKAPTLVVGGDNDKVIPNYLQKLLVKELPNAKLYLVRNGSHVPQVDFPEFVNERLELFLEQGI